MLWAGPIKLLASIANRSILIDLSVDFSFQIFSVFQIRANNHSPWIYSKPYLSLSPTFSLPPSSCHRRPSTLPRALCHRYNPAYAASSRAPAPCMLRRRRCTTATLLLTSRHRVRLRHACCAAAACRTPACAEPARAPHDAVVRASAPPPHQFHHFNISCFQFQHFIYTILIF